MAKGYIPVYLPDRTVVGRATISEDQRTVTIDIPEGTAIQSLMADNLVALSVVYQGAIPFEMDQNKEKESDG